MPPSSLHPLRLAPSLVRASAPPRAPRAAFPCLAPPFRAARPFHRTSALQQAKPKGKPAPPPPGKGSASGSSAASADPFDFAELQAGIAQALERLQSSVQQLRPGGRLAPEALEAVRVKLPAGPGASAPAAPDASVKGPAKAPAKGADKAKAADTVRLGDVAQVVPRSGRTLALLLADPAHAKAVTSALLGSVLALNATAAPGPAGAAELHVAVPPPTLESRNAAKAQAGEAGDKALAAIRSARQAQHKKHKAMEQSKAAREDDVRKAGGKMEEVVKKGSEEVKKVVEAARRAMDG